MPLSLPITPSTLRKLALALMQKKNISTFKMVIVIVIVIVTTSCTTTKQIQTIPVETLHHDTLYINKQFYDSIYIDNTHLIDRGGDTITITKTKTEYRFRLLRDTIYKVRIDSIPFEVRITEAKEVPRPRNFFDYVSYMCFGLILGLLSLKIKSYI